MHLVIWTYQVPPTLSKAAIEKQFVEVAGRYLGVPGLARKYFCVSDDGKTVIGVYHWESKAAANAFYTAEWLAGVTQRWGAAPQRSECEVTVIADNVQQKLISG